MKIKTRTKIEAVIIALFLLLISVSYVSSLTRRITSTSDNAKTFIWNSNGNCWASNGNNIQVAIDDLDENWGTVTLAGNTTYTISSTIELKENCFLDMNGATININGNIDAVSVYKNAQLKNGIIDVSGIAGYDKSAILFDGDNEIGNSWYAGYGNFGHTIVENMYLQGEEIIGQHPSWLNGTAIKMVCDGVEDGQWVIGVICQYIDIHSFEYGIYLDCSGGGVGDSKQNYINSNYFDYIWMMEVRYGITTDRNEAYSTIDSSVWGNHFENIMQQTNKNTDKILWTEGDYNEFEITAWDWGLANNTAIAYNLTSLCNTTRLKNMGGSDYVEDNGFANWVDNQGLWASPGYGKIFFGGDVHIKGDLTVDGSSP